MANNAEASMWSLSFKEDILEIGYRQKAGDYPQIGAVHLKTGAVRLIPDRRSRWGPQFYLPCALWMDESQAPKWKRIAEFSGAPLDYQGYWTEGGDLVLNFLSAIEGLNFTITVRLSPPAAGALSARVHVTADGTLMLAERPNEAFKPVAITSMHVSNDLWDSQAAFADSTEFSFPAEGFIQQILGWREYMRGVYWALMPDFAGMNFFGHDLPLPNFYWTAETCRRLWKTCFNAANIAERRNAKLHLRLLPPRYWQSRWTMMAISNRSEEKFPNEWKRTGGDQPVRSG